MRDLNVIFFTDTFFVMVEAFIEKNRVVVTV